MSTPQPEKPALRNILELGAEIIAANIDPADLENRALLMQSIEVYVDQCSQWLQTNVATDSSAGGQGENLDLTAQVRQLLEQHTQVLDHAKTLLNTASQELREFQRRGKGIMRYADYLPKSISMATKLKG